jgi:antitoxin ParD1/3/4
MATMNVSLPDEMKEWVEAQAANGRFANVSDYVRDVLRREQTAIARFQTVIDEAMASGVVDMTLDELFEDVKRRSREKILATAEEIRAEGIKADDAA